MVIVLQLVRRKGEKRRGKSRQKKNKMTADERNTRCTSTIKCMEKSVTLVAPRWWIKRAGATMTAKSVNSRERRGVANSIWSKCKGVGGQGNVVLKRWSFDSTLYNITRSSYTRCLRCTQRLCFSHGTLSSYPDLLWSATPPPGIPVTASKIQT